MVDFDAKFQVKLLSLIMFEFLYQNSYSMEFNKFLNKITCITFNWVKVCVGRILWLLEVHSQIY